MGERAGSKTNEFQTDMDGCRGACASIADCAAAVWVVPGGADGSAGDCWMKSALTDVYASRIEHRVVFTGCETKCPEDGRDLFLFLKKQKKPFIWKYVRISELLYEIGGSTLSMTSTETAVGATRG